MDKNIDETPNIAGMLQDIERLNPARQAGYIGDAVFGSGDSKPVRIVPLQPALPTLRDQFAMLALRAWLDPDKEFNGSAMKPEQMARYCYQMADAMLVAREQKP